MDLCKQLGTLFGTEDYVRMRRQLVFIRENIMNCRLSILGGKVVCSGSLGEGVAHPLSDDDLMFYSTNNRVMKSYREATQRFDVLMVPSEFSPGYCMLLDVNESYTDLNMIHIINEMPFLSAMLWKKMFLREGESLHGPCVSNVLGGYEYDFAHCLQCCFWPDAADNWISRNRSYGWPSFDLIRDIVMNCCHVVPIGDKTSASCQHEWRLSFSVAERKLFHSFNHTQFLTYNLLRLCVKNIIKEKCPGVICSYFMKTTLFYVAENTPTRFWQPDNIESCFKTCLSLLYDYVFHGFCPNFFVPENNMMKGILNHSNGYPVLEIIRMLHSLGVSGTILACGESFEDPLMSEVRNDVFFFKVPIHLTLGVLCNALSLLPFADNVHIHVSLSRILRLLQGDLTERLNNIFVRRLITVYCQSLIHRLKKSSLRTLFIPMNKRNYSLHKIIQLLLSIVYNEDVTTGKLTTATYLYLVGKTDSALSYIRRLLSEYPPYVIDHTVNLFQISLYTDFICGKGYTMDYKVQKAYSPSYFLPRHSIYAFPSPLRILISTRATTITHLDPLSYAYFLESLCYIRLQDHTSLEKSTRCLINRITVHSNKFFEGIDTRICVGLIKSLRGESQSACRWLGSAYLTKIAYPTTMMMDLSVSVMTYVACMINNRYLAEIQTFQNA